MHANKENPVDAVTAGHIYAVIGLKDTTTGDTLCDPQNQVVLESMTFPEPVIEVAIEPKTKADQEKLGTAIQKLAEEDPTFRVEHERGDRPDRSSRAWASSTSTSSSTACGASSRSRRTSASPRWRTARRSAGRREATTTRTRSRPVARASSRRSRSRSSRWTRPTATLYEFENKVTGGRIPREYIPSVDARHPGRHAVGVLAGYPMVGVKATLLDGACARRRLVGDGVQDRRLDGLKEAVRKADPVLLEPIMAVEVRTPEEYMGDVIGDLNSRRGQIQSMEDATGVKVVRALVPLSEMFGYIGDLRSKTSGRAVYSMEFDSYAEVPRNVADEIVKKARASSPRLQHHNRRLNRGSLAFGRLP